MKVKCYEELIVWQKAMQLAKLVYLLQKGLPKEEIYGLGDQIRRAVVSVPSNIAEGYGRGSDAEFKRFLAISRGSLFELKTQLQLAEGVGLLNINEEVWNLIEEVGLSKTLTANR